MEKVCQQVPIRVSKYISYFSPHLSTFQGSSSNLHSHPAEVCQEVRDCGEGEVSLLHQVGGPDGGGQHQDMQQRTGGEVPALHRAQHRGRDRADERRQDLHQHQDLHY